MKKRDMSNRDRKKLKQRYGMKMSGKSIFNIVRSQIKRTKEYQVRYQDGQVSFPMTYLEAREIAAIFNAKIERRKP